MEGVKGVSPHPPTNISHSHGHDCGASQRERGWELGGDGKRGGI